MSALGYCQLEKCHGSLCISGKDVTCENCGLVQAEHPLQKEMEAERKAKKKSQPEFQVRLDEMVGGIPDRVNDLEICHTAMVKRVLYLEQQIALLLARKAG